MKFRDLSTEGGQLGRYLNPCADYLIGEYLTIFSPFRYDLNHLSGIGVCDTVLGWDAVSSIQGVDALTGSMELGEIVIRLRPVMLSANGFGLSLFLQNIEVGPPHLVSAWVSPPVYGLKDGMWQDVVFGLEGYVPAGNNPVVNNPDWQYVEKPFTTTHRGTMALSFIGGVVTGALELDTFEIREI